MFLWDLLTPLKRKLWEAAAPRGRVAPAPQPAARRRRAATPAAKPASTTNAALERASAQDRYDALVRRMLAQHGVKVRKWRTSMSGVAWQLRYRDGSVKKLIEAPRPKGPMSAAVFLHEIGHHAIGFNVYRPRCLEEYHAWAWALRAMDEHGVTITQSVRTRMHRSLAYAVAKAKRRGLASLPKELEPFAEWPAAR